MHRMPSPLAIARTMLDLVLVGLVALAFVALVIARVLPAAGHDSIVVRGRSMEPAIGLGSVIVLERVAASWIGEGDVVTITVPDRDTVYTHRVAEVVERADGRWLRTKGDNNETADPALVPVGWTTGRVIATVPGLGYLLHLLSTVPGILAFIGASLTLYLAARVVEDLEGERGAARRGGRPAGSSDGGDRRRSVDPARSPEPAPAPAIERAVEQAAEPVVMAGPSAEHVARRAARRAAVVRDAQRARSRRLGTSSAGQRGARG
jgi:signal peptidase